MRSAGMTRFGLLAGLLALAATPALAAKFECPKKGGDLVFGGEAKVNSLDQHTSSAISGCNNTMNMLEALMTRDAANKPILDLAEALDASDDGMTYTFKLRQGIMVHNGKDLTTDDVGASWDRYKSIGYE